MKRPSELSKDELLVGYNEQGLTLATLADMVFGEERTATTKEAGDRELIRGVRTLKRRSDQLFAHNLRSDAGEKLIEALRDILLGEDPVDDSNEMLLMTAANLKHQLAIAESARNWEFVPAAVPGVPFTVKARATPGEHTQLRQQLNMYDEIITTLMWLRDEISKLLNINGAGSPPPTQTDPAGSAPPGPSEPPPQSPPSSSPASGDQTSPPYPGLG